MRFAVKRLPRTYYKLLRQIVLRGQERGELRDDLSANEITKLYALCERALMYDWCICNGEYSLKGYAKTVMPMLLSRIRRSAGCAGKIPDETGQAVSAV